MIFIKVFIFFLPFCALISFGIFDEKSGGINGDEML